MDLLEKMRNNFNNFNDVQGATPLMSSQAGGGMIPQMGNPAAITQIDLNVSAIFSQGSFDSRLMADYLAGPAYEPTGDPFGYSTLQSMSEIEAKDLYPNLKVSIPVILFGNSDFASGFKKSISLVNVTNWLFLGAFVVKSNSLNYDLNLYPQNNVNIPIQSVAISNGKAKLGDMVLCYYNVVGTGVDRVVTICEIIIKCPQVGYGTLLDAISSDTFKIGGIRYTVQDITKIAQFDNEIGLIRQSMFGKTSTDSINPNSQKLPSNQQANIIDVPLVIGIDKNQIVTTYINYDVPQFTWSLFIPSVTKIKA